MENFAVIDLGSNSVRMTVVKINDDGSTELVKQSKEFVRLSANMGKEKTLKKEPVERTLGALKDFKQYLDSLDHLEVRAVATAAVRQAVNRKKFLKKVKDEVGFDIKVISGDTEAYYDYLGVTRSLPANNCVIVDTGGASSEIILVQNGRASNLISIPVGSVTLSQQFGLEDEVSASKIFELLVYLNKVFNDIWWLRNGQNLPVIGLGGSNRTIAKINRNYNNFLDFEDIHGYKLSDHEVNKTFGHILELNCESRKKVGGLSKTRADIIIGGLAPIVNLMQYLDSDRVMFSKCGLRDGIIFEKLDKHMQERVAKKEAE
ncbi:Ppx/GppA family phosphatase [Ligilactobacillus pobuzihii]|uniref:Ppx GppA phosphatase n=1 Tax=Ligilactobacillus pobuzihii TaxID=449659 RepID=A0A0R2LR37_9LACO|nr:Ppx/GppA family phosphatase [Ligilactobacillus pobuzihii]KRK10231.1 Ppx GppA phosphatase [Ligilactobacillus pobuzihii E100301 = KCTC 13174]KRO02096.1 Ppx GppA phosphatase [Ligilactobacillus pobuzihii]GEN48146.1 exopolyphosphatase [Ligilactobacillus pobuzihii]